VAQPTVVRRGRAPQPNTSNASTFNVGGYTYTWTTNTAIADGEKVLWVYVIAIDGGPTLSIDGSSDPGWAIEDQDAQGSVVGAIFTLETTSAFAAGSMPSLVIASSAAEQISVNLWAFRAQSGYDLGFLLANAATGSSTNSDPPSLTNSSGASIDAVVVATRSGDSTTTPSAAPTNYGNLVNQAGAGSNAASTATADRSITIANSASENPGVFTVGSEQWVSYTFAVYEFQDVFSQAPGVATETDLAASPSNPLGRADSTEVALSRPGLYIRATGMATSTEVVCPTGLGRELVTNGGWDSDLSGWTVTNLTATWLAGGGVRLTAGGVNGTFHQALIWENLARYQFEVKADATEAGSSGSDQWQVFWSGSFDLRNFFNNSVGTHTWDAYKDHPEQGDNFVILVTANTEIELDYISVKPYGPIHPTLSFLPATETDTALQLFNPLIPTGRADETDTALALSAVIIRATGLASTTDTAPLLARGAELVVNGDGNAVTAWLDAQNSVRSSVNGRIRVDVFAVGPNAVAYQDAVVNIGPLHYMAIQLSAGNAGANPWAQFQDVAGNYYINEATTTPPKELYVAVPTTSATLRVALVSGAEPGQWAEFDNVTAYQLGSPAVGISVTPALETDTAFPLGLVQGIVAATEADLAFTRSHILIRATGTATEIDSAFALAAESGASFPVGMATETDTALSRSPGLAVNRANETDTAFIVATGHGTGRALETDLALPRGIALPVQQGNSTDLALRLGVGLSVNRASETDLAVARIAIMLQATGFALEVDEAFNMLFGLEAREGFVKPVNLAWLDKRIQPVFVKANVEQVP
jgi:hypothetical protein